MTTAINAAGVQPSGKMPVKAVTPLSTTDPLAFVRVTARSVATAKGGEAGVAAGLAAVAQAIGYKRAEWWSIAASGEYIALRQAWFDPSDGPVARHFDLQSRGSRYAIGQSLPGLAWHTRQAQQVEDVESDTDFLRRPQALAAGLKSALAIPAISDADSGGVLVLIGDGESVPGDAAAMLQGLEAVANLLAAVEASSKPTIHVEAAGLIEAERVARADAERSSAMKDHFVAMVSHELRTPLNAILGWAQILRRTTSLADVAEAVGVIERNARVQTRLIDDLLDISRLTSGQLVLESQRVELEQVIEAAVDAVLPQAAAKRLRIDTRLESFGAPVLGDPARLQQIIANVLSNAVKYTPDGGRISVTLESDDAEAKVVIRDTGMGIAKEEISHVFERYRQGAPKARKAGGLGLGMAIAKHLAERHGGHIQAESEGLGKGSTFTLTLPLAVLFGGQGQSSNHSRFSNMSESELPRFDGLNLLVVDDEADARRFIQRILEDRGATVQTAGSMDEAIRALDQQKFDLVVSDIAMPEHDGYELIHRVRQLPADRGGLVRAVALTAFAQEADHRRSIGAGFNMHLCKPVDATDLLRCVSKLLGPKLPV